MRPVKATSTVRTENLRWLGGLCRRPGDEPGNRGSVIISRPRDVVSRKDGGGNRPCGTPCRTRDNSNCVQEWRGRRSTRNSGRYVLTATGIADRRGHDPRPKNYLEPQFGADAFYVIVRQHDLELMRGSQAARSFGHACLFMQGLSQSRLRWAQLVDDFLTEQRVSQRTPTPIVYCYGVWQPRFQFGADAFYVIVRQHDLELMRGSQAARSFGHACLFMQGLSQSRLRWAQLVDDFLTEQRVSQRTPTPIVYCYGVWQPRFNRKARQNPEKKLFHR